jgi:hypothetical protein
MKLGQCILFLVIGLVAGFMLHMKACSSPQAPATVTIKADTQWLPGKVIHDTIPKPYPVEKIVQGKPYPVEKWDTIWLPLEDKVVDSLAIVRDYFVTRQYRDTLWSDSSNVVLSEKVNQNKLFDRQLEFNLRERQITNTNIIPPKLQLYTGLDVGASAGFASGGLQFTLKTARDNMYHAGISFTTLNSFYFHIGTDWKISFKK